MVGIVSTLVVAVIVPIVVVIPILVEAKSIVLAVTPKMVTMSWKWKLVIILNTIVSLIIVGGVPSILVVVVVTRVGVGGGIRVAIIVANTTVIVLAGAVPILVLLVSVIATSLIVVVTVLAFLEGLEGVKVVLDAAQIGYFYSTSRFKEFVLVWDWVSIKMRFSSSLSMG